MTLLSAKFVCRDLRVVQDFTLNLAEKKRLSNICKAADYIQQDSKILNKTSIKQ